MTIKILNLYAGIGGNRKLWGNEHEITAIENNQGIAKIYQDFFPNDKVIVCDAHEYLLKHFNKFDFIWSSPPCPSHSRMNFLHSSKEERKDEGKLKFPDMKLYEEIIFLKHWFKGKWVVENVKSYYSPLIRPFESGNHFFWSNFIIGNTKKVERGIRTKSIEDKEKERGFKLPEDLTNNLKEKILNNCVFPELGLHILNMAFKEPQTTLK